MRWFSRWFERNERKPGEYPLVPTRPEAAALERVSKAISSEGSRSGAEPGEDAKIRQKIQYLLDTAINPAVAGHGGVVSLVDVKDRIVCLQMGGGCQGCGMADVTLKQGVEMMIREEVPEVAEIVDVTDHAAGQNPYFTASKK
jgi:Fe-S cluster biogenesis protein NfuA